MNIKIGLDWIHKLMDWIGLGLEKWTHVHLLSHYHPDFLKRSNSWFRSRGNPPSAFPVTNSRRRRPSQACFRCSRLWHLRRRRCVDKVACHKYCRCLLRDPVSAAERVLSLSSALRPTVTGVVSCPAAVGLR